MSMSVEQRRTEVLEAVELPTGKVRLVKASSRYDRRQRYLAVEWCEPRFVDGDLEEHAYRVLSDWWPARSATNRAEAFAFFRGAHAMLLGQARLSNLA
jgi:hypothetical protein